MGESLFNPFSNVFEILIFSVPLSKIVFIADVKHFGLRVADRLYNVGIVRVLRNSNNREVSHAK